MEAIIEQLKPIIVVCAAMADFLMPYLVRGFEYLNKLYHSGDEYGAEEFMQVCVCFYVCILQACTVRDVLA